MPLADVLCTVLFVTFMAVTVILSMTQFYATSWSTVFYTSMALLRYNQHFS